MEEIGCHFKFENVSNRYFHNTDLNMSSGRNCLRYIIKERAIKTIFLPYFLCESLSDVAQKENISIIYYHINNDMMPVNIDAHQLSDHTFLYFVNYYGILRNKIKKIIDKYKYVIIDNTHDFFDNSSYNADVIYNYRKYFGVPDGACIVSKKLLKNSNYPIGKSLSKIIEMVCRDETGEYFHYNTFLDADKHFSSENLCYISNFTRNYIGAIDYNTNKKKRINNYMLLKNNLGNEFNPDGIILTYMYPYYSIVGEKLRQFLKDNNIYSLMLWPNVMWNGSNDDEKQLASNIVLIPIDQRYSESDMAYIIKIIKKFNSINK